MREDKLLHVPARGWIWSLAEETFPQGTDFCFGQCQNRKKNQGVNHYWRCVTYSSSSMIHHFDGFLLQRKNNTTIVVVAKTGKVFEL